LSLKAAELAQKISKMLSDVKVEAKNNTLKIVVQRDSFSLTDLPVEVLKLLSNFDGLVIVEIGGSYYFYFKKEDVVRALKYVEQKG
jgi:hypothetical protein